MKEYILINDIEIINKFFEQIDEVIINLYNDYNYLNYVLYNETNKIVSLIKVNIQDNYCNLVFWCEDLSNESIRKKTKIMIKEIQRKYNVNVCTSIISKNNRYINFFKNIGFNKYLKLREHIRIKDRYYDIECLILRRKR